MRIGILSLNPGHNYGGILQSYALQTILETLGHNVTIICKDPYEKEVGLLSSYKYISRIIRMIKHNSSWEQTVTPELSRNKSRKNICKYNDEFMKRYLRRKFYSKFSEVKSDSFDCIIVGSDQVWRQKYFEEQYKEDIENAFLSFAKDWDIKRYSYAASFGISELEYNDTTIINCGNLLKLFDQVSVREKKGIEICLNHFGVNATEVLDPTMLLNAEDYMHRLKINSYPKSKGNMMVYLLDINDQILNSIKKLNESLDAVPFFVGINNGSNSIDGIFYHPIEQWIRGFFDADIILTDSFHACVFSILFKKQFLIICNKDRGTSRFDTLLEKFEINDRYLNIENPIPPSKRIDYQIVSKLIRVC